jgi:hypothetical protein
MKETFTYGWYLTKHRYFTMMKCFSKGLIWRGLKHDLSKYSLKEFFPYAKTFYGKNKPTKRDETGYYSPNKIENEKFLRAWNHHIHNNDHHWQYYINICDRDEEENFKVLEMPDNAVKEMLCDWYGASKAQKNKTTVPDWYRENRNKMILHINTERKINKYIKKWYNVDFQESYYYSLRDDTCIVGIGSPHPDQKLHIHGCDNIDWTKVKTFEDLLVLLKNSSFTFHANEEIEVFLEKKYTI